VQPAEIAAEALKYSGKIVRVESLTPDSSPRDVLERNPLARRRGRDSARRPRASVFGGHGYLLGATRSMVDFRKAALVRIDRGRNRAHAVRCSAMDADAEAA